MVRETNVIGLDHILFGNFNSTLNKPGIKRMHLTMKL